MIPLTLPEVRRLLTRLAWPVMRDAEHWRGWSEWRRRHQAEARRCHYRTRGHSP